MLQAKNNRKFLATCLVEKCW